MQSNKTAGQYARQIGKQSGIFFLGAVFATLVGFFFKIYIARELGATALGIYAMGLSIVQIVGGFSSLGLGRSGIKFISRYKARRQWYFFRAYLQRTSIITFVLSTFLAILVYISRHWISDTLFKTPEGAGYMVYFSILVFISGIGGVLQAFAQGFQRVDKQTIINDFIRFPVKIAVTVGLIIGGFGLTGYILGEVVAAIVSLVLMLGLIWKLIPKPVKKIKLHRKVPWDKSLLSMMGVMLGLQILSMFAGHTDKLILGGFMTPEKVGIYSVAITLGGFIFILLRSLNTIFAPVISELHALGKSDEMKKIYYAAGHWVFILTIPLAMSLMAASESYMKIFGNEFAEGAWALTIISFGYLINVSFGSIGMIAQMTGLEKPMFNVQLISSIASIVLFWVLIPFLGLIGAAVAISIGNILTNILVFLLIIKKRKINIYDQKYIIFVVLLLIQALVLHLIMSHIYINSFWLNIIISLILSLIFVTGTVFMFPDFIKEAKPVIHIVKKRFKRA